MIELVKETEYHKRKENWTIFGTISSFLLLVVACSFVILSTAGAFTFLVAIVAIIGHLSNPEQLGLHMAVAILSLFYCSIVEILLIPTAVRLYKKHPRSF